MSKRTVNFELNLVPFVDLLSTLICFLLLTSVWQELDAISTSAPPPRSAAPTLPSAPIENQIHLSVAIGLQKTLLSEGDKTASVENIDDHLDVAGISTVLKDWKTRHAADAEINLRSANVAKYKYLVQMMDTLASEDFSNVAIDAVDDVGGDATEIK